MIRFKNIILVIFLIIELIVYPVSGQETSNATVSGKIVDYLSGEPLGYATVMIYDSEGYVVSKSALSYSTGSLKIYNNSDADSTEYIFEIVPGFAHETSMADIMLTETTYFRNQHDLDVFHDGKSIITLYPSLPEKIEVYYEMPNEYFPEDSQPMGKILFESASTNKTEYELPIQIIF